MAVRRTDKRSFRPGSPIPLESRIVPSSGTLGIVHSTKAIALDVSESRHNVIYRDVAGDRQILDVLIPKTPAPPGGRPVIVAIHGGGWRKFSKEEYEPTVRPFVALGYDVVVPNYRLSKPGSPTWPLNFLEVSDAIRWVRSHASEIGANPDRISSMGESAGGHLAALLGTDAQDSARVQAVIDFYGPTDLAALERLSRDASLPIRQYLGATPSQNPSRYADASPITHVSAGDPPFLIIQGTADPVVVPSQSRQLAARLSANGVKNHLIMIPGAGHGFGLHVGSLNLLTRIDQFLRSSWT